MGVSDFKSKKAPLLNNIASARRANVPLPVIQRGIVLSRRIRVLHCVPVFQFRARHFFGTPHLQLFKI